MPKGISYGVANIMGVNFSGFIAWWRTIYLSKLPRLEKKVRVALGWSLDLFFSKDIVQFKTNDAPTASPARDYPAIEKARDRHSEPEAKNLTLAADSPS